MTRPSPLSGYPEWLPAHRAVEQRVLDVLRETFELHGFASVETRAVEPLSQLLRKGEIDHEVYLLRRLHEADDPADAADAPRTGDTGGTAGPADAAGPAAGGDQGGGRSGRRDPLALHYDLTVPFARYVLEHAGHLQFPFRRYQIQKVWRGERPQEGRYREFCQADIDVVDKGTLSFHYEVEMAQVMGEVFARLPLPPVRMQLNNRKVIEGYYRGLDVQDVHAVMRIVDKLDKIGPDAVRESLRTEAGLSAAAADRVLDLAGLTAPDAGIADRVQALGVRHPLLDEGLDELVRVLDGTSELASGRFTVVADLRIARGLDYYTGTVYETRLSGFEDLGSICSGGRYDELAADGDTTYPGVGISLGVTRLLGTLFGRGVLSASRPSPTCVLVALPDESSRNDRAAVARALRTRGIAAEVAPAPEKYGKQIRYADRRGIPYVWFPAPGDARDAGDSGEAGDSADQAGLPGEVRDIRSGEQVAADARSWNPPEADLRPQIVSTADAELP